MPSFKLASSKSATGMPIMGFYINEDSYQTWSGSDVQDGKKDPAATTLRIKVDVGIRGVYRDANNIFRFKFDARLTIVRKDEPTQTHHALTERERGELKSRLGHLARIPGGPEQTNSNTFRPVHSYVFQVLRDRLWLSAFSRVGNIEWEQSLGPKNLIYSYLDEKLVEDVMLKMLSHLEEEWLSEKGLQFLRDMPTKSMIPDEGPINTGRMSPSEVFAWVVLRSELHLQLDE